MSFATGTNYRITFKSKRHNLQWQRRPYTVVICQHKSYITFVIDLPLMMAQSRTESTWDTYNYGQYINQSPPNSIKVIQEFERIQKKICRHKMSIMFHEICTYIYKPQSNMWPAVYGPRYWSRQIQRELVLDLCHSCICTSCGTVANMPDGNIVVSEFKLQSCYHVHFCSHTLTKGKLPSRLRL